MRQVWHWAGAPIRDPMAGLQSATSLLFKRIFEGAGAGGSLPTEPSVPVRLLPGPGLPCKDDLDPERVAQYAAEGTAS